MSSGVMERARNAFRARRKPREDPALIAMAERLRGAVALEPGGPSAVFEQHGALPVYARLAALDTLDYSERTLWSEDPHATLTVRQRLIGEARRLRGIEDDAYDALLASHVLEHLADPLGTLGEWQRVVRPGGHVLLVMPHREGTFDHRRPVTSLEHMHEDAQRETGEDDLTHLPEILELHDLRRDPGAPNARVFEQRCRENPSSRAMHHHVFDTQSVVRVCQASGLQVVAIRPARPFNIFCLCTVGKSGASTHSPKDTHRPDDTHDPNGAGLSDHELARVLADSPFKSDRAAATARSSIPAI